MHDMLGMYIIMQANDDSSRRHEIIKKKMGRISNMNLSPKRKKKSER